MKVVDLRTNAIVPFDGEEVNVLTDKFHYECVAVDTEDRASCEGCVFDKMGGCERISCSRTLRPDKRNIIIKVVSRKEVTNEESINK